MINLRFKTVDAARKIYHDLRFSGEYDRDEICLILFLALFLAQGKKCTLSEFGEGLYSLYNKTLRSVAMKEVEADEG